MIRGIRRIVTKRGKRLAIVSLEDSTGSIDLVVFSEIFDLKEDVLVTGEMLVAQGEVGQDDYNGGVKITASALYSISEARGHWLKCIRLNLLPEDKDRFFELKALLSRHSGDCPVHIAYANTKGQAELQLSMDWGVLPTDLLFEELTQLLDKTRVEVCY